MNVPRGYEGAKNEAFLSLWNRQVPRRLHDPPPSFVTYLLQNVIQFEFRPEANHIIKVNQQAEKNLIGES